MLQICGGVQRNATYWVGGRGGGILKDVFSFPSRNGMGIERRMGFRLAIKESLSLTLKERREHLQQQRRLCEYWEGRSSFRFSWVLDIVIWDVPKPMGLAEGPWLWGIKSLIGNLDGRRSFMPLSRVWRSKVMSEHKKFLKNWGLGWCLKIKKKKEFED